MNGYEYRIHKHDRRLVQVRPKFPADRAYSGWQRYMLCDTPEQASRILAMLQHGNPETVMLP